MFICKLCHILVFSLSRYQRGLPMFLEYPVTSHKFEDEGTYDNDVWFFSTFRNRKIPSKDTCHLVWDTMFYGRWISILEEPTTSVFSVRVEDGSNVLSRNFNKFLPICMASHHKRKCHSQSLTKWNPGNLRLSVADCYLAFRSKQLPKPRTAVPWEGHEPCVPIAITVSSLALGFAV